MSKRTTIQDKDIYADVALRPDGHKVHDLLWIGGDVHYNDDAAMAQFRGMWDLGIRAVIDAREEHSDKAICKKAVPEMVYHYIPTDDHGGELSVDWWIDVISAARPHIEAGEPVFVHCHMGVNRGPSAGFAILVEILGFDPIEAFDTIKSAREQAFVIYAPQFVKMTQKPGVAKKFMAHFNRSHKKSELHDAIGRIRQAEARGYRIPLVPVDKED